MRLRGSAIARLVAPTKMVVTVWCWENGLPLSTHGFSAQPPIAVPKRFECVLVQNQHKNWSVHLATALDPMPIMESRSLTNLQRALKMAIQEAHGFPVDLPLPVIEIETH